MFICQNSEGVHPYLLKCCRGTCSFVGMLKRYMVRKRLGTPDLNNVTLTANKLVFGIYELEFCAGQEPTFAGQVWEPAELCVRVWVELSGEQAREPAKLCMQVRGGSNLVRSGRRIKNFLCGQLNVDSMHAKVTWAKKIYATESLWCKGEKKALPIKMSYRAKNYVIVYLHESYTLDGLLSS